MKKDILFWTPECLGDLIHLIKRVTSKCLTELLMSYVIPDLMQHDPCHYSPPSSLHILSSASARAFKHT